MSDSWVEDDLPRVDRSTLEAYANCPLSARLSDRASPTFAIVSGTETHKAISDAITEWIDDPTMNRCEMAEKIRANLNYSRPDVQPDAIRGGSRSAWEIASLFQPLSPAHVLKYDGGEGSRSGQLSFELRTLPVVVTCEVDLLVATASRQQVVMADWKSGWKQWTANGVADSFQFQFYAALVLQTFPDVQSVIAKILNTRTNCWTYEIEFERSRIEQYMGRINTAAAEWWKHHKSDVAKVPAWPGREKCEFCRVASRCHAADVELSADPVEGVRTLQALAAKTTAIETALIKHVRDTGRDIETPDGLRFGFDKPKANRKPTAALYAVKSATETEE